MKGIVLFTPLYGDLSRVSGGEMKVVQPTMVHGVEAFIIQNFSGDKPTVAFSEELKQLSPIQPSPGSM